MSRDSCFGERILWESGPQRIEAPAQAVLLSRLLIAVAAIALSFGVARVLAFGSRGPAPLLLALAATLLSRATLWVPRWWLSQLRYRVTDDHVICKRGLWQRSIERNAISYARISWRSDSPGLGTLELVRAFPTGALRRTLTLRLQDLRAPDGVWAIIRGASDVASSSPRRLSIGQRLDRDERVIWAARPRFDSSDALPINLREWVALSGTLMLGGLTVTLATRGWSILRRLSEAGFARSGGTFLLLALGLLLTVLVVGSITWQLGRQVILRRLRALRSTSYLISNKRVVIQRGEEELHLERSHIVEVIDSRQAEGRGTLFLVLDGPRSRGFAAAGAFGEPVEFTELSPVFEQLDDPEGAQLALSDKTPLPPASRAA